MPMPLVPAGPRARALTLPSDEAFLGYFAGHETRDLATLLGRGQHRNLRIVYARGDIPVLRQDLKAVAPMLSAGAIVELPKSIGHTIEAPFAASAYRPHIDGFLDMCLAAPVRH